MDTIEFKTKVKALCDLYGIKYSITIIDTGVRDHKGVKLKTGIIIINSYWSFKFVRDYVYVNNKSYKFNVGFKILKNEIVKIAVKLKEKLPH